ncbi:DUF423 domain-containing protein [Sphingomonas sp. AOB5]|uniref:DUF423 domain-containing protein n=1 Tax=Sphingomonas sp. AOB5 TaxID=3034017 RepID=UPI0023F9A77E|nr:DUF423 domain-containing protein [Sphingomonas sp. AOB5]MDF7775263.1 DUF423 domain-containing protein [Sphingomonas sp. AOB5]
MRIVTILACLSGALAVIAGAFGAHGASGVAQEWLKTGAQYQMVHAVAALVALRMGARWSPVMFVSGGLIFAGTLYLMALGLPRWLGAVTPIGGVLLIAGWVCLAFTAAKSARAD